MVFPENDYTEGLAYTNGVLQYTHSAWGADMFRYSMNFGMNYTNWTRWEDTTVIPPEVYDRVYKFWDGDHIMVQCELLAL